MVNSVVGSVMTSCSKVGHEVWFSEVWSRVLYGNGHMTALRHLLNIATVTGARLILIRLAT